MRYEVPQFIDIEDKIFGPLTFVQAVYLAGAAGASFSVYYVLGKLDVHLFITLGVVAIPMSLGLALAFVQINRRPFIYYMEAAFYFFLRPKRHIWKKKQKQANKVEKEAGPIGVNQEYVPKMSRSKIKDLAWKLDMDES